MLKYTNKECHTMSDMHALHNMPATLFNNHPYKSSSGTPVGTKLNLLLLRDIWLGCVMDYISHTCRCAPKATHALVV